MLAAAAMAISVMGSLSEAKGAKQNAAYQAAVARNNAAIADTNAVEADQDVQRSFDTAARAGVAAQKNAENQDYRASEVIADEVSAQAVSGLAGGSQTRVIATLRDLAGLDRQATILEGEAQSEAYRGQARKYELEAADLRSRARVYRTDATAAIAAGNNAARGHYLQAAGTVIGFAGDMAAQAFGGGGMGTSLLSGAGRKTSTGASAVTNLNRSNWSAASRGVSFRGGF